MTDPVRYDQPARNAAIICSAPVRAAQLRELALACDYRIAPAGVGADYVLADISSEAERAEQDCSEIADYLNQYGAQAIMWIEMDQLEAAYAALPPERCHWLIDADDALAVPILARANGRANMDQVQDRSSDGEYRSLHRISDELADFARTLARIAEQDGEVPTSVRDKPVGYRAAPAELFEPLATLSARQNGPDAKAIRNLIKLRRLREQHFDADLFADPAWDILLDLFAAQLEGKSVSVSSLCIAASVPPTTALRWITSMTEHGALVRKQDPNDARRVFIALSADSEAKLRAYFADIALRPNLPI
jgi:DNA-binding MarR family transcriptional regulator